MWSFGIEKKGNAVGLGQKCIFIRKKRRFLLDLYLNELVSTILEAKQQKRRQKRFLVCVDIKGWLIKVFLAYIHEVLP